MILSIPELQPITHSLPSFQGQFLDRVSPSSPLFESTQVSPQEYTGCSH